MSGSYEDSNGGKKASLEKRDPREAGSALMNGGAQGSHTSLSRQPVVGMADVGYRVGARNSTVLFSSRQEKW